MIRWFETLGLDDLPLVGGKNASLGEMLRALPGVRVPTGFATTAAAWRGFIARAGIEPAMRAEVARWRAGQQGLAATGAALRALVEGAPLPAALEHNIRAAYAELGRRTGQRRPAVAVRSSATAEDLPGASFAGLHESRLNVRGGDALVAACRFCFASLFTDRALSYREARGFDHFAIALSLGVQQMVRASAGGAGIMFSIDPDTGFPRVVVISAAWGLGEPIVQGQLTPDRHLVFKPLLDAPGVVPIIESTLGAKQVRLRVAPGGQTRLGTTPRALRDRFVLGEGELVELARWAVLAEAHYRQPMDLEWARDGADGPLYLVQARPETAHGHTQAGVLRAVALPAGAVPLLGGVAVGEGVAHGPVARIADPAQSDAFPAGAILVTANTDPDWVPLMRRAAGIVTERGGATSHAAIVARELGVPAIIGTGDASALADGAEVTLACSAGQAGQVFAGRLAVTVTEIDPASLPATRTPLMLNIADPGAAFHWWRLPAAGVGLARMEFIIGTLIGVHPLAVLQPERLSASERRTIARLARGHASPADWFVATLAAGIARLATPFHPHPAIVRFSDFKTNEYAHLLGGRRFEPVEENPMLGWRGASRYHDPAYRAGFALECRALARARGVLGLANIIAMIPFCRTPAEADRVLAEMAANGLVRGAGGLKIYMMCEIPANVILASDFARRFDGFSIGSNDLTQLTLGVDRDSARLAALFDERDPAVLASIASVIASAHAAGIPIGICGEAPSNHPDIAAFLVRHGIDSISLNPASLARAATAVAAAEA